MESLSDLCRNGCWVSDYHCYQLVLSREFRQPLLKVINIILAIHHSSLISPFRSTRKSSPARFVSRHTSPTTWRTSWSICSKSIWPNGTAIWRMESMISRLTNGSLPQIGWIQFTARLMLHLCRRPRMLLTPQISATTRKKPFALLRRNVSLKNLLNFNGARLHNFLT